MQQNALARKAKIKNELEQDFRFMVDKYLSHDARQMISEHEAIFAKQNASAGGAPQKSLR